MYHDIIIYCIYKCNNCYGHWHLFGSGPSLGQCLLASSPAPNHGSLSRNQGGMPVWCWNQASGMRHWDCKAGRGWPRAWHTSGSWICENPSPWSVDLSAHWSHQLFLRSRNKKYIYRCYHCIESNYLYSSNEDDPWNQMYIDIIICTKNMFSYDDCLIFTKSNHKPHETMAIWVHRMWYQICIDRSLIGIQK